MPTEETTEETTEYFVIRFNKKTLKKVALVAAATTAAVVGVTLVKRNLSIETTEDSLIIEKADTVNGI